MFVYIEYVRAPCLEMILPSNAAVNLSQYITSNSTRVCVTRTPLGY